MKENAREFALWLAGSAVTYSLRGNGLFLSVSAGIAVGLGAWYLTDKAFVLAQGASA